MIRTPPSTRQPTLPLLPLVHLSPNIPAPHAKRDRSLSRLTTRPRLSLLLAVLVLVLWFNSTRLGTYRRDLGYLLRPLWDRAEPPFRVIPHCSPRGPLDVPSVRQDWCARHGWTARSSRPTVVDSILLSSELDMLEIRMREYAPLVTTFLIVEADRTFSGERKPLHFQDNRERFERLAATHSARIVYRPVLDLVRDAPKGSFENEAAMRRGMSRLIEEQRGLGHIPPGGLILQSDVDEIVSRQALELLTTCQGYPDALHLSVKNYRYGFNFPLLDGGYWRPHIKTVGGDGGEVGYTHGRVGDTILAGAGWHCSFCFGTLEEMRGKMGGYSHNDRLRDPALLGEAVLRDKVCSGQDPFGMWPEVFSYHDLFAQSGPVREDLSFGDVPVALREDPDRFSYLLAGGCSRPDGGAGKSTMDPPS